MKNIIKNRGEGEPYKTPNQHFNNLRKRRIKSMLCVVTFHDSDEVSSAAHGVPDEMMKLFVAIAATPELAPYIMMCADVVEESLDTGDTLPQ